MSLVTPEEGISRDAGAGQPKETVATAVVVPPMMGNTVPVVAEMSRGAGGAPEAAAIGESPEDLLASDGMVVKQNFKDIWKVCLCQPNYQWTTSHFVDDYAEAMTFPPVMFIQEDAPCCQRSCSFYAPGCRKTQYNVHAGGDANGELLLTHSKGQSCGQSAIVACSNDGPIYCPMCCCLPYLNTNGPQGEAYGSSKYICDCCLFVPKFVIKDAAGQNQYLVRPNTCCAGACIKCDCAGKGGKCCAIPFMIRDPTTKKPVEGAGGGQAEIVKLWAGLAKECCGRNNYSIRYPASAPRELRATLMGSALLMDITLFEIKQ